MNDELIPSSDDDFKLKSPRPLVSHSINCSYESDISSLPFIISDNFIHLLYARPNI